jgi:thermitase
MNLLPDFPYWKDMIFNKEQAKEKFIDDFDQVASRFNYKFWVTSEYKPASRNGWLPEEIFSELNLIYRVIFQNDYEIAQDFIEQVKAIPFIKSARLLEIVETPLPNVQLSLQSQIDEQNASDLIYLPVAQKYSTGLPQIKIAVLDTGVNLSHKELEGKFINSADFVNITGLDTTSFIGDMLEYDDIPEDEVGHGTHVAGIIAANGVNMQQGVCPNCKIMPVRVLASMKNGNKVVGAGIIDNINAGIKWAVDNGADIINMSLGIKNTGGGLPHEDVINYALSKNVTIVAASGNDGTEEKYYPGALPGVIAVGATDNMGSVTRFTSYGASITVVAPGLNIYSSYTNNTYAFATGTSQASPFVCGAIGLLKSYALKEGKKLTNEMIHYILKHSSDKIDDQLKNQRAGYGLINLADAFKLLNYIIN